MVLWYCIKCPYDNGNDLGPWDSSSELFPRIKQIHGEHEGWNKEKPKTIQEEFTESATREIPTYDEFKKSLRPIQLENLAEIENPELANKKIKSKAVVTSNSISYYVANEVKASCHNNSNHSCDFECNIKIHDKDLVQFIDVKNYAKENILRNLAMDYGYNFNKGCDLGFHEKEFKTIKRIRIRPVVSTLETKKDKITDNEGKEWKSYDVYILQNKIQYLEAGREIEVTAKVIPDPKSQKITLLVLDVYNTDNPEYNLENIDQLRALFEKKTISQKIKWITNEFSSYSKIINRETVTIGGLLAFFSQLYFEFEGKTIPAWVKISIIGDTRTAKSETIRKLIALLKGGLILTGETATMRGIAGHASQAPNNQWFIEWGPLVTQDRKLLAIDGFHKISKYQSDEIAEAESSGKVMITKAGKGEAPSRTRQIKIMNPLDNDFRTVKSLEGFFHPAQCLQNNFQIHSIARQDLVIFVSDDVSAKDRNQRKENEYDLRLEFLADLLKLGWEQKFEIEFTDEAIDSILQDATKLENRFKLDSIPLITNDQKYKLAKLAASLAILTLSFNEDYSKLTIKAEHVEYVTNFVKTHYHDAGLDILASENQDSVDKDTIDDMIFQIKKSLEKKDPSMDDSFCKKIIVWIAKQPKFTRDQLFQTFELAENNMGRPLVTIIQSLKLVSQRNGFSPTRLCIEAAKFLVKKGESALTFDTIDNLDNSPRVSVSRSSNTSSTKQSTLIDPSCYSEPMSPDPEDKTKSNENMNRNNGQNNK